ncbi:MAG: nitroreductase family protein [Candidatus Omnitrophica bacterium]|nr:nitroreductase family protein [Candidatus Omnitrophota bacterium]
MIKDIIKKSRSYRRFDESHEITRDLLMELVELARFCPSARNQQALKFKLLCTPDKNDLIFPSLSWAGYLPGGGQPSEGERPSAYIIILGDTGISKNFYCDHGIAAQSMLLGAVEKGLGGCILGSVKREELKEKLNIPDRYEILLVIALGKPVEKVVLEDIKEGGDIKYYRDENKVHHVPKRKLDELILN